MKKVALFCGINSIGMPFPRVNRQHIGYFDIVKQQLENQGHEVNGINISSLNRNHTWDLQRLLERNYNLAQIKNIQMKSIDRLRNANALFKLVVPKKYKERFQSSEQEKQITFKEVYENSENPIFLYSAGQNDFFTYINAGPVELLNAQTRDQLQNIGYLVKKSVDNVEENWNFLHDLNPKVQIFSLSTYDSPLFHKIQTLINLQENLKEPKLNRKNNFLRVTNLYNKLLEERTQKYDFVEYVDITFLKNYCAPLDFHPNTKGNELIAEAIMEKIEAKQEKDSSKRGQK